MAKKPKYIIFENYVINMLMLSTLAIGFIALIKFNIWMIISYAGVIILSFLAISKVYCSKCPVKSKACIHYIPGKLAMLFKDKKHIPYKWTDWLIFAIIMIILHGFPQFALIKNKALLILFWTATVLYIMGIFTRLCIRCFNRKCTLCRNKKFC